MTASQKGPQIIIMMIIIIIIIITTTVFKVISS